MGLVKLLSLWPFVVARPFASSSATTSQDILAAEATVDQSPVTILPTWDVIGPFRLGTREAVWGADPLEFYGGIQYNTPNGSTCFPSPLARNATVQWARKEYSPRVSNGEHSLTLSLDFDGIDWEFAQKVYGWSAFQYQAWAKGEIFNWDMVSRVVNVFSDNIIELWINDMHVFGGDFFGFGRIPMLVQLHPGVNNISVRLVREVRSMGGGFPPTIQAGLRIKPASEELAVVTDGLVMPNVVNGRFCTRYGSIPVRNQGATWIYVRRIAAVSAECSYVVASQDILLAPGQSRPVKMVFDPNFRLNKSLELVLVYSGQDGRLNEITFTAQPEHVEMSSLQRITYTHPSGTISYAMLKPPPTANKSKSHDLPVIVNLHGAGVEVDGPLARHMFDDAPHLPAWILTPTGMSPWSGDDWHTWGFADAQSAVAAVADWIDTTGWDGPRVYSEKLLVAGHSNGAAVASGYSSIENYVPYVLWNEASPLQNALLENSRSSFRHEILTENLVGISILQQHGSADDNVPAYHSRLMNVLLAEVGQVVQYAEMLHKGHWFDGTMTTKSMMEFYWRHLTAWHPNARLANAPDQFLIDDVPHVFDAGSGLPPFVKTASNVWGREVTLDWRTLDQRFGRQRGALDAILRTTGPFQVVHDSDQTLSIAVQTSRNFLQYFGADTTVVPFSEYGQALDNEGNVLTICLGLSIPEARFPGFPIRLANEKILITAPGSGSISLHLEAGMGGVWLRPLPRERLELVVWGFDEVGLRQAARLIPTVTGAGQPDFVLLGNEARWKGHAGAIAMGFFDRNWKISSASYLP
ncbi:hypothetical protein AYO20_02717 [Fonsecaea nubica]|uniref:Peptidase S9 prolyl oligopeptidase catalytic domain-containing protein n=1 Tax=Fonsecaea nubica TaxID=856822 RepID=A0A178D952_9EURO|nr:hypothetical protein AYO20_02717 [Fonsecaea nubica]OAL37884.1 hypothetical protein AYO20_02717 [Fonsecaea nubica]